MCPPTWESHTQHTTCGNSELGRQGCRVATNRIAQCVEQSQQEYFIQIQFQSGLAASCQSLHALPDLSLQYNSTYVLEQILIFYFVLLCPTDYYFKLSVSPFLTERTVMVGTIKVYIHFIYNIDNFLILLGLFSLKTVLPREQLKFFKNVKLIFIIKNFVFT